MRCTLVCPLYLLITFFALSARQIRVFFEMRKYVSKILPHLKDWSITIRQRTYLRRTNDGMTRNLGLLLIPLYMAMTRTNNRMTLRSCDKTMTSSSSSILDLSYSDKNMKKTIGTRSHWSLVENNQPKCWQPMKYVCVLTMYVRSHDAWRNVFSEAWRRDEMTWQV